jgi:hypothetical protein
MKVNRLCAENPFSLTGQDAGPSATQQNAHSAKCLRTNRCVLMINVHSVAERSKL